MNNKGLTLVELLVSLAVSAVVLVAAAGIIFSCLKMFGRTNANVELQSDAQTTMNVITENIKDATGIYLFPPTAGDNTTFILLDEIAVEKVGNKFNAYFKGNAIATNIDESDPEGVHDVYLLTYPNEAYTEITTAGHEYCGYTELVTGVDTREQAIEDALTELTMYPAIVSRDECLLSQDVTACKFDIPNTTVFTTETINHTDGTSENIRYYTEPLVIRVTVDFQAKNDRTRLESTLTDNVFSRNRLEYVEIDLGDGNGMLEYKRKH